MKGNSRSMRNVSGISKAPLPLSVVFAAVAVSMTAVSGAALAEDAPSNAELYKMLLELKAENARLREELEMQRTAVASGPATPAAMTEPAAAAPASAYTYRRDRPNFELGVEVPYLSLRTNHGAGEQAGGNGWFDESFDHEAAYRLTASYVTDDGLGVRGRYFRYSETVTPGQFFKTNLYDLELMAGLDVEKWSFTAFGGLRGGEIKWSDENGASGFKFDGIGFTVGAEARRYFGQNFAFLLGARHSQLFGEIKELANSDKNKDNVVPITDLYAGLEYVRSFSNGSRLGIGLGYEAALFSSLSGNVDNDIDPEDVDISLTGPRLTVNYGF